MRRLPLGTGRLWYGLAEIHENRSTVGREFVLTVAETLLIFKVFHGLDIDVLTLDRHGNYVSMYS